jgi:pimeloyl-ACP methyl ester carboxylesterase
MAVLVAALFVGAGAEAQTTHPTFDVTVSGRGRPLVLIPGLLSTGEVWSSTVDRYKDRYELHVLTLAGFGGPSPVGPPFLSRVRDDVIRYVRDRKLERPVIIGHSLGGFLAFWIAATAPDLVGGVVALDGVPYLPALSNAAATPESMHKQADQIKALYASQSKEQLAMQSRMAFASMMTSPADVDRAMTWVAKADAATAGIAVAEMLTTDLREQVAAITAPVLLIGAPGSAPEPMRPTISKNYELQVAKIKGARVVMAPTARHFVMLDDPKFVFSAVDEFLAKRQGAGF